MASIADLPPWMRAGLHAYPWRKIDPVPCSRLAKPLAEARVALVTAAGLVPPGGADFDPKIKGGDWSYRVIAADAQIQDLKVEHRSFAFDHSGIAQDRNLAFPLDRLRELAASGEIGTIAPRHLSFMGSITAPGRLIRFSAPDATTLLVEDQVDVVLFVPV